MTIYSESDVCLDLGIFDFSMTSFNDTHWSKSIKKNDLRSDYKPFLMTYLKGIVSVC